MSDPQTAPRQVPLGLSAAEQWIARHVLLERSGRECGASSSVDPPPAEVCSALEKLDAGTHLFTPAELGRLRSELRAYLGRTAPSRTDRATAKRVIERITAALEGRRSAQPA